MIAQTEEMGALLVDKVCSVSSFAFGDKLSKKVGSQSSSPNVMPGKYTPRNYKAKNKRHKKRTHLPVP